MNKVISHASAIIGIKGISLSVVCIEINMAKIGVKALNKAICCRVMNVIPMPMKTFRSACPFQRLRSVNKSPINKASIAAITFLNRTKETIKNVVVTMLGM